MKREGIDFCDVMALGFTRQLEHDSVYEEQYGYPYTIVSKFLYETKKIEVSADWDQTTRKVSITKHNKKSGEIIEKTCDVPLTYLQIIDWFLKEMDI